MSSNKKLLQVTGTSNPAKFVENIFSTNTFTSDSSNPATVDAGTDLAGEGGMVWTRMRELGEYTYVNDTVRGTGKALKVQSTDGEMTSSYATISAFSSTGFTTVGHGYGGLNRKMCSWTFRKAPKFFDVVQYTGTGSSGHVINHSLGSTPGAILVKRTSGTANWVWHQPSIHTASQYLLFNSTSATLDDSPTNNFTNITSTSFQIDSTWTSTNASGSTYIAYLFGHDTSDEGMIQCGTVDVDSSSNATVNLGFEPQWALLKTYTSAANWEIQDSLRNWTENNLRTFNNDTVSAEVNYNAKYSWATSTGFQTSGYFSGSQKLLYVAVRKAPMQTPTTRASVFAVESLSGASGARDYTTNFPVDMILNPNTSGGTDNIPVVPRLMGQTETSGNYFRTNNDTARTTFSGSTYGWGMDYNNKWVANSIWTQNQYGYAWRRAPGFFDVVLYDGNNTAGRTITHNLGAVPEMIWIKNRGYSAGEDWAVYHKGLNGGTDPEDYYLKLNANSSESNNDGNFNDTAPTSTVFTVGSDRRVNGNVADGNKYIAHLFATLAGISKVGSFSHTNGSSTDVDCGFSSGSSFVIAKRRDASGDWYLWDSARGIVSGAERYFLMNTQDAEVINQDYIDPLNSGFQIASGFTTGDYIFYAIAS